MTPEQLPKSRDPSQSQFKQQRFQALNSLQVFSVFHYFQLILFCLFQQKPYDHRHGNPRYW